MAFFVAVSDQSVGVNPAEIDRKEQADETRSKPSLNTRSNWIDKNVVAFLYNNELTPEYKEYLKNNGDYNGEEPLVCGDQLWCRCNVYVDRVCTTYRNLIFRRKSVRLKAYFITFAAILSVRCTALTRSHMANFSR